MLRTWFIIIMAFKNVLFNRDTGLLQTFQKHQLATAEETSQEGCTPCVKLLISAKRHFLPNHILSLEDNEKRILYHILFQRLLLFPALHIQNETIQNDLFLNRTTLVFFQR